jgi:hypothetical protein
MSTLPRTSAAGLSGGRHRDSDRGVILDWRGHCRYGCRSGDVLPGGLLS